MKLLLPLLFTACSAHKELEIAPKQADSDELYNKILAEALPTLVEAMKAPHVFVAPPTGAPQRAQYWFDERDDNGTYEPTRTLNGFTLTLQGYTERSLASRGDHHVYAIGHAIDTEFFLQVNEKGSFAHQQNEGTYTRRTADENTLTIRMTKPLAKKQTYLLEGLDNGVVRWLVPIAECKEGDTVLNFYNHTEPDFCQREGVLDDRGEIQLMTFYDAYREFIDARANPLYSCIEILNVTLSAEKTYGSPHNLSYVERETRDAFFSPIVLRDVASCYMFMDEAKKADYDYLQMQRGLIFNKESFDARLAECPLIIQPFEEKQTECRNLVDTYNLTK